MRVVVADQFPDPTVPELAYQLDGLADREQTLRVTIEMLMQFIPCDGLCWNLVNRKTGEVEVVGEPDEVFSGDFSDLAELDDHPMIESYLGEVDPLVGRPRRVSDLIAQSDFHRTHTYNELFRRTNVEHMLTILTERMTVEAGRCFTFTRSPGSDFTADDLARATRLQPVLRALDAGIATVTASPSTDAHDPPTRRELQVAAMLARGLTADACAHALRVSPRTVHKHVQNLYAKLGAHDRVTALAELRRRRLLP